MSSWSKRRRALYAIVVVVVFVGAIIVPAFLVIYRAPTCADNKRNGNELGVDCGGSCERLCQNAFSPASLAWTRFEEVAPRLYNVAAYIVNPNIEGEATNAPYHFALYDNRGVLITDVIGAVTLPPHRNTLAFEGAIDVGERVPARALFEFTAPPDWHKKSDSLSSLIIGEKKYIEDHSGSSLVVTLKNTSVHPLGRMTVYAILYDKDGNALGFSKTIVDDVPANGEVTAPFTWPIDRMGSVISFDVLPVADGD